MVSEIKWFAQSYTELVDNLVFKIILAASGRSRTSERDYDLEGAGLKETQDRAIKK